MPKSRTRYSVGQLRIVDLGTLSYGELRKAYTTYRDVLVKRVMRLSKGTPAQKRFVQPFMVGGSRELKTLAQLDTYPRKGWTEDQLRRELLFRVKEFQILEQKDRLSITGWKRIEQRTIEMLRESGYENISSFNIKQFGEFMERMREQFKNKIFPSEEIAEAFNTAVEEKSILDKEDLMSLIDSFRGSGGVDLFS